MSRPPSYMDDMMPSRENPKTLYRELRYRITTKEDFDTDAVKDLCERFIEALPDSYIGGRAYVKKRLELIAAAQSQPTFDGKLAREMFSRILKDCDRDATESKLRLVKDCEHMRRHADPKVSMEMTRIWKMEQSDPAKRFAPQGESSTLLTAVTRASRFIVNLGFWTDKELKEYYQKAVNPNYIPKPWKPASQGSRVVRNRENSRGRPGRQNDRQNRQRPFDKPNSRSRGNQRQGNGNRDYRPSGSSQSGKQNTKPEKRPDRGKTVPRLSQLTQVSDAGAATVSPIRAPNLRQVKEAHASITEHGRVRSDLYKRENLKTKIPAEAEELLQEIVIDHKHEL